MSSFSLIKPPLIIKNSWCDELIPAITPLKSSSLRTSNASQVKWWNGDTAYSVVIPKDFFIKLLEVIISSFILSLDPPQFIGCEWEWFNIVPP